MKIQDVEVLTGLDRATIRFYEKEQLLVPERSENGYRNYTDDDVKLLQKVKLLRKLGVSLNTIKQLEQGSELLPEVLYHIKGNPFLWQPDEILLTHKCLLSTAHYLTSHTYSCSRKSLCPQLIACVIIFIQNLGIYKYTPKVDT